MDPKGHDYEGLHLVARAFADDVRMVSGAEPEVVTDAGLLKGTAVIAVP